MNRSPAWLQRFGACIAFAVYGLISAHHNPRASFGYAAVILACYWMWRNWQVRDDVEAQRRLYEITPARIAFYALMLCAGTALWWVVQAR